MVVKQIQYLRHRSTKSPEQFASTDWFLVSSIIAEILWKFHLLPLSEGNAKCDPFKQRVNADSERSGTFWILPRKRINEDPEWSSNDAYASPASTKFFRWREQYYKKMPSNCRLAYLCSFVIFFSHFQGFFKRHTSLINVPGEQNLQWKKLEKEFLLSQRKADSQSMIQKEIKFFDEAKTRTVSFVLSSRRKFHAYQLVCPTRWNQISLRHRTGSSFFRNWPF